jgi:hypothetical protein
MLAQQSLEREDARAAISAGTGRLAHLRHGPGARVDSTGNGLVVDDLAVADDHGNPSEVDLKSKVSLT